jgi:hypothetical protein
MFLVRQKLLVGFTKVYQGGTWKGVHTLGALKDECRALETVHLSVWELYEGFLDGWLLYWGPRRIC